MINMYIIDRGVGKSSLIIRFAEGKFPEYIPTGYVFFDILCS